MYVSTRKRRSNFIIKNIQMILTKLLIYPLCMMIWSYQRFLRWNWHLPVILSSDTDILKMMMMMMTCLMVTPHAWSRSRCSLRLVTSAHAASLGRRGALQSVCRPGSAHSLRHVLHVTCHKKCVTRKSSYIDIALISHYYYRRVHYTTQLHSYFSFHVEYQTLLYRCCHWIL